MTEPEIQNLEEPVSEDVSFGEILSEFEQTHTAPEEAEGPEQVTATLVSLSDDLAFFDVGRKMEGVLPIDDLKNPRGEVTIAPGATVPVSVTGRTEDGYYTLSLVAVETPKDWSGIEKAFEEKAAIAGTVTEQVKGGFRVDIGVPAFMPASRSGARDEVAVAELVGQEIQCRIIKLDVEKEDVVVDRRSVLEEQEAHKKDEFFQSLAEGQVVEGVVRRMADFGAFVDIGGIDGLLHVSDMSWGRNISPSDVVKGGDRLTVKVLKINREKRRIGLGLKQLQPDPWSISAEKYPVGSRVSGTVARLADFGAFVELEPGVEGLIHLSEMSWSKRVRKPSDVVNPGESVEVVVLSVSPGDRRIGLGLKQALGDPWEEIDKKYPPGTIVEGQIANLAPFGAFVKVTDDVEGMIHVGDITSERRINHPNEIVKAGQTVRAQVLEVDKSRRRLRLGMKQLEPTSADVFIAEHQQGDTVSGRIVRVGKNRLDVEVAEGVTGVCPLKEEKPAEPEESKPKGGADIGALSAMLAARWKEGAATPAASASGGSAYRTGQVHTFRIARLDADSKRIDLELAG